MVMPTLWKRFVDTLLPPAEASVRIRPETTNSFISVHTPHYVGNILVLSRYQNNLVQAAVTANKFHHDRHAARLLAHLLVHHLQQINTPCVQIIPVPLSRKRQIERGYNQVELVLHYVTPLLSTEAAHIIPALSRAKDTTPQTKLDKEARLQNVNNAFRSNRLTRTLTPTQPIWLLDDVATTGATLHAARAAFPKKLQRQIQLVALAG